MIIIIIVTNDNNSKIGNNYDSKNNSIIMTILPIIIMNIYVFNVVSMIVLLFYDSSNGKEYSLDSFYMNSSSINTDY